MGKALLSFQIVVVVAAGIGIGAAGYHVANKADQAVGFAHQCKQEKDQVVKDLNEKILPEIQKQLAALQEKSKIASK